MLRRVPPMLLAAVLVPAALAKSLKLEISLDPLLNPPASFAMSQDQFEKAFPAPEGFEKGNPVFSWLTRGRDRAVLMSQPYTNVRIDLSILDGEVPCNEATIDFVDGAINGINISIYNRADGGEISAEDFENRFQLTGRKIGELLEARPTARKADASQGLLTEGWIWSSKKGLAVLEKNPEAAQGDFEFLRLRLAPAGATGPISASMQPGNRSSVRRSDLPDNVVEEDNGDVVIQGIPMVDQGPKGYCVVASAQRLFEYYGIPCDQHQLAQVVGSDVDRGTNSGEVMKALGKLDYRFKTRFDVIAVPFTDGKFYSVRVRSNGDFDPGSEFDDGDFERTVKRMIDAGIPILWSLEVGLFPEEPAIAKQARGGHMRMIIGYNEEEEKIIFTDSWGAGHELKKMKMDHAFKATQGLYTITPTVN